MYICITCHKKLLKGTMPAQAVCNNLQILELPSRFRDLRKLEKIIIAKPLLFKKVTIMPKGQCPKSKGAICNVPINADFAEHLQFRIMPFREQPLSCFENKVILYFRKYVSKLFREGV